MNISLIRAPGRETAPGFFYWARGKMSASWQQVAINGGGYVTGMDMAPDGTMVCRVDVFGAYLNTAEPPVSWQLLTTTASLPSSAWGFTGPNYTGNYITPVGVYEIRIAASNTSIFYMMMNGKMYFTSNKGSTWTLMSGFPSISWSANENDAYRTYQKKIGISPTNPDIVYVGTPSDGLYGTTNGTSGASAVFAQVASVPVSTAGGITGIVFDASGNVYCCSNGHGVYKNGSLIAGSPTTVYDAMVSGGVLYCATPAGIQSWNGTWVTILSDGAGISTLAINPFNTSMIACMANGGGNLNYTTGAGFQGTYWDSGLNPTNPPSDTPWLADTKPGTQSGNNWSAASCWFDPLTSNRFWISWGYGVSYIDLPNPAPVWNTPMVFASACKGLQNTVATCAISPSTAGYTFLAAEDVQFWRFGNPAASPTSATHGTGTSQYGPRVELACWSMDCSQSVSGVVAALEFWNGQNASAYSTDKGIHWTQFPTAPTAHNGGCITCVDSTHFIAVDANNSIPVHTTDGGTTWTTCTGLPSSGWPSLLWNNPQILCNDAGGTVYAYSNGNGLYASADKGATFSLASSQNLLTGSWGTTGYDNPKLSAVPGNAGYLLFGSGLTNGPFPQGAAFWKSTNAGVTWTAIPNVVDVWCHGYGMPSTGYSSPTLWIVGWVMQGSNPYKWGIWRSRDLGVSDWQWMSDFPNGLYDQPRCITGDAINPNTVFIGYQGSSYMYGKNL